MDVYAFVMKVVGNLWPLEITLIVHVVVVQLQGIKKSLFRKFLRLGDIRERTFILNNNVNTPTNVTNLN